MFLLFNKTVSLCVTTSSLVCINLVIISLHKPQFIFKVDEIENEKTHKVEDKKLMDKMVAEYQQDKADETRM